MVICLPVHRNIGMNSIVFETFSCAPEYVITDTVCSSLTTVDNIGQVLQFGTCDYIEKLDDGLEGRTVDAVIVLSIGSGMLHKFNRVDIQVFQAKAATVGENLVMMQNNLLVKILPVQGNHAHDG